MSEYIPKMSDDEIRTQLAFVQELMASRQPDFVIGDDYLRRWWVIPRNYHSNIYLHEILRDDQDRDLHNHPWDSVSMILQGGYKEITPEGEFIRRAGDVVHRKASDFHRLEMIGGKPCITLFHTGPAINDWGFDTKIGFVPWREYMEGVGQ